MAVRRKKLIEWRRGQTLELISKGHSQSEIASMLHVSDATICKDLEYLRQQSKENIKKYVDEKLPNEYEKCLIGLTAILKEAWATSEEALDRREKIQALTLAKDCYTAKLDLLTNATVVDDAMRFLAGHSTQKKDNKDKVLNKEITNEDIEKEIITSAATTDVSTSTTNRVF